MYAEEVRVSKSKGMEGCQLAPKHCHSRNLSEAPGILTGEAQERQGPLWAPLLAESTVEAGRGQKALSLDEQLGGVERCRALRQVKSMEPGSSGSWPGPELGLDGQRCFGLYRELASHWPQLLGKKNIHKNWDEGGFRVEWGFGVLWDLEGYQLLWWTSQFYAKTKTKTPSKSQEANPGVKLRGVDYQCSKDEMWECSTFSCSDLSKTQ